MNIYFMPILYQHYTALYKTGKKPVFMELMFYFREKDNKYTGKFIISWMVINARNAGEQCQGDRNWGLQRRTLTYYMGQLGNASLKNDLGAKSRKR